jgi:hypothetical protein
VLRSSDFFVFGLDLFIPPFNHRREDLIRNVSQAYGQAFAVPGQVEQQVPIIKAAYSGRLNEKSLG